MTDSTRTHLEDPIDRYVRSELTPAEARDLAQESLRDLELFEDLTYSAVTKAALTARSIGGQLQPRGSATRVFRLPQKARTWVVIAAAAAAVGLISLYSLRSFLSPEDRPRLARDESHGTATVPLLKPALAFSAKPGQPVLLARNLQSGPARHQGAPVFRGLEADSRSPRPTGSIVSIEDDIATIDLGSLDGVTKGSELSVFSRERSTEPIGRLKVATVFRERARGRILTGQEIQIRDSVRVPAVTYLDALLQQVTVLSGRGDPGSARAAAEKAVRWADTAKVPPRERGKALEQLAALEYQAGSFQVAEKYYEAAIESFKSASATSLEESEALNSLAVLRMLRGDYDRAETLLSQAVSKSTTTDSVYSWSKNNLGVLAELRGDRRKAEDLYTDALHIFAGISDLPEQERRGVETNLARVRSSH